MKNIFTMLRWSVCRKRNLPISKGPSWNDSNSFHERVERALPTSFLKSVLGFIQAFGYLYAVLRSHFQVIAPSGRQKTCLSRPTSSFLLLNFYCLHFSPHVIAPVSLSYCSHPQTLRLFTPANINVVHTLVDLCGQLLSSTWKLPTEVYKNL